MSTHAPPSTAPDRSFLTPDPGQYLCPGCPSDYVDHQIEMPIGEAVCLACGSFLQLAEQADEPA